MATYNGTSGNDVYSGTSADDDAYGAGGDDVLNGNDGSDYIQGDAGGDTINGGNGDDHLVSYQNDQWYIETSFDVSTEVDTINGGAGWDYIAAGYGDNVDGGDDVDYLYLNLSGGTSGVTVDFTDLYYGNTVTIGGGVIQNVENTPVIYGTNYDDTITAYSDGYSFTRVHGNGGNDHLIADYYNIEIYGDDGDDLIDAQYTQYSQIVSGGNGNDVIYAPYMTGTESVYGDAGNDIIYSQGGDIYGGDGNDTIHAALSYYSTHVHGGNGNDSIDGSDDNETFSGDADDDTISAGGGNDVVDGGTGNDLLDGGAGNDTLVGGDGTDTAVYSHAASAVTIDLTVTTAQNTGAAGSDTLSGIENLIGSDYNDTLKGDANANVLNGGLGADAMYGRAGNDTYIVDNAGDQIFENADEGTDTVKAAFTFTLAASFENVFLTGSHAIDGTGNELDNILVGNSAANTLTGDAGNDYLKGGAGADTLIGGTGDDTYVIDSSDTIVENAGEGTDTIVSADTYVLGAVFENLTLTGSNAVDGTGNASDNVITGNSAVNTLTGGAGDDRLNGGAGADVMYGGTGNDTYVVDNAGDQVHEYSGQGTDLVESSVSFTLAGTLENLTLTGSAAINGIGNGGTNVITGNNVANSLSGMAGSDTLYGGGGNDILNGGADGDAMYGGTGNDTYVVDDMFDQVYENAGQGIDTIKTPFTTTLSANLENLTLTGDSFVDGTGNAADNIITGNIQDNVLSGLGGNDTLKGGWGNDTLNGGTGVDSMSGGVGDDIYYVDNSADQTIEKADEGIDTVYSSASFTLGADVENLILTGTSSINGTGNALANTIQGNDHGNVLSGGAGNDSLQSYAGTDTLDGGTGADAMYGGIGNDLYIVDNEGDQVFENAAEGTDKVQSSVGFSLGANVENLTLTGTADIYGDGNDLVNVIQGNEGANTLYGENGNDTLRGGGGNDGLVGGFGDDRMYGGTGDDSFYVDSAADQAIEYASEGTDTVYSSISLTLGSYVENLVLLDGAYNGTGNNLANTITGNLFNNILSGGSGDDILQGGSGNDTLNGGTGADRLYGGLDDDAYVVDNVGDKVFENASEGTDTVQSSVTYTLGSNVENLTLTGGGAINGTGNGLDNIITGNTGANVLTGNAGNDTIDGGAGADTMYGGAGNDTFFVDNTGDKAIETSSAGGADLVQSSVSFALGNYVEDLTLTGSAAIDGTGNNLANTIVGNAADNVITGGGGADMLTGGGGVDTFVFTSANDSTPTAADHILDFSSSDLIDLSAIDADTGVSADQAFARVAGDGAFTAAGQLRLTFDGSYTHLELNRDADADAEVVILLAGNHTEATATDNWIL